MLKNSPFPGLAILKIFIRNFESIIRNFRILGSNIIGYL